MRPAREFAALSVPTWALAVGWLALGAVFAPLAAYVLMPLWTLLVLSDLHPALPEGFYQSERTAVRLVGLGFVLSVVAFALYSVDGLLGLVGLPVLPLFQTHGLVLLAIIGVRVLEIRHVLSAVESLEAGEPRTVPVGATILNLLLPPLYVLCVHYRARRALQPPADHWAVA